MGEVFYYSKNYSDIFDSVAWRLIFAEPMPIPAYATMIYYKVLAEATKARGTLLRDSNTAYSEVDLMKICSVRPNDPDEIKEQWRKAYSLLIGEGILSVDEKGVIRVSLADELFGSETEEARKSRKRRARATGIPSQSDGQFNEDDGSNSLEEGVNDASMTGQFTSNDPSNGIPLNEDESSSKPPKSKEQRATAAIAASAAEEFVQIYPKKTAISKVIPALQEFSEIEIEALLIAARKVAKDPAKTEQNGRFAADPLKYIKSRPWSDADVDAAEAIIWGRRQSKMLEEAEG